MNHLPDFSWISRRLPMTSRELTLTDLSDVAGQLGFANRALRVGIKKIAQIRLPAILYWDQTHFVVLKSVSRQRLTINDLVRGLVSMTHAEVADHFTGVAVELVPTAEMKR